MNLGDSAELRALRELFQTCDAVPNGAVTAAYAAGQQAGHCVSGARTATALELVGDSADDPDPARVRAWRTPRESRVLTFMIPGRIVEMDLTTTTPGLVRASGIVISRSGQATPQGELVLRHPDGVCSGALDQHGAFHVDDVPRGPVCVAFRPDRSAPAIADWLVC